MPKGYWIAHVTVEDADRYQQYLDADAKAFEKYHAKPIVRGGQHILPEGKGHERHVVIEFETYEKALECYNSPEYQEAIKHRLAASQSQIVIVEGVA